MDEVPSPYIDLLLGALDARGIPRDVLVGDGPWTLADLEPGDRAIAWSDFVEMFERFAAAIGGATPVDSEAWDDLLGGEALFRSLAESAPDSILVLDAEHRVRYANRLVYSEPGTVVGRPFELLVPDENRAIVLEALTTATREARVTSYEIQYPTPRGDKRWYEVHVGPIERGGVVVGAILIARDVQDQREAVEERFRLERHLQHAQRLESLGVLAGGIAHDFNNLLTGILANADLLLSGVDDEVPAFVRLDRIAEAARRAAALTSQMLAYAGRAPVTVSAVDMVALARETRGLLAAAVPKGVRLDVVADGAEPLVVEGDRARLQQVVMNLVTNAAEASAPSGGVRIELREAPADRAIRDVIGRADPVGPWVVVEVADEGEGLEPGLLQRIFDPFFSTRAQGRGLGLATVVGIVRQHGGALEVDSEPGRGSTFRVYLPASDEHPLRPRPVDPSAAPARGPGGTVLVVDDEDLVRETAGDLLRACGFEVIMATDGTEALERVADRGDRIDAVLLDLSMPGPSGIDVFYGLCDLGLEAPVVLSSAYELGEDVEELWALGLGGVLRKPYSARELVRAIREQLEEQ